MPLPVPNITALNPTSGIPGTVVQITGTNMLYANTVKFGGFPTQILSQTSTTLTVAAPSGPPLGAVSVLAYNENNVSGTAKVFTYLSTAAPVIASLVPTSGPNGTLVQINGSNFLTSQGASTVKFNGVLATVISWSSTLITATVPSTATTGPVVVTVGGINSNSLTFTITNPSNGGTSQPLNLLLIPAQDFNTPVIWTLDPTNFDDPGLGGFYNWKVEDVIAGRTPTVSRVIVSYRNLGVVTFTLTLTGTDDSGNTVTNSVQVTVGTAAATQRICTKVVGITLTGQNIQPGVSRVPGSGPLSITKLRLEGRVETTVY